MVSDEALVRWQWVAEAEARRRVAWLAASERKRKRRAESARIEVRRRQVAELIERGASPSAVAAAWG